MRITTFLMFTGEAEAAMSFYVSLFPRSQILSIERYGPEGPGPAGTIKLADFELNGTRLMCIDSPAAHTFTFTTAMSLYIDVDDLAALEDAFTQLSEGGQVLMPPDAYGFSTRFAWLQDRFGVSWQLNLP